ncbi:MAG: DUF4258 domain-containing protein [Kosmotogaceae bacterium]
MLYIIGMVIGIIIIALIVKSYQEEDSEHDSLITEDTEEKSLKVSFSTHAIQRMDERKIEPERVYNLLDSEKIETSITESNRIKIFDDELTAVIAIRDRYLEIVTVFWNNENNSDVS